MKTLNLGGIAVTASNINEDHNLNRKMEPSCLKPNSTTVDRFNLPKKQHGSRIFGNC